MFVGQNFYTKFGILRRRVYHPPSSEYLSGDFLDFLIDAVERLLSSTPNARLIIDGDVNQLDINCLLNQHSLAQIVKIPTRGVRTLDVFLTNFPQLWTKVRAIKSLVRSDHLAVLVKPVQLGKSSRTRDPRIVQSFRSQTNV